MALYSAADRRFAEAVSRLGYCNPFLPERIDLEREALGPAFIDTPPVWSMRAGSADDHPNIEQLERRAGTLVERLRKRLAGEMPATDSELALYEDLVLYLLYHRYRHRLLDAVRAPLDGQGRPGRIAFWKDFRADYDHCLTVPGRTFPMAVGPARLLAGFFQLRRAFDRIFHYIVGGSMPAARLRAAVWQSIFTHDMRRYHRTLYGRMGDITTLVTGPSGTGKELVARAVGMSRYIPFDAESERFTADFAGSFHAVNLSALSPTLIESELFGHRRGAFTGAVSDRTGWLEVCGGPGTVFLDEIGDLDAAIQVKLLRVFQTRTFQRLGETKDRRFHGKIIAATNRDLAAEMRAGRFREDFYYRLCSDMITTPSLAEQLADSYDDLHELLLFIARRVAGEEAPALADEVYAWIETHLGRRYPWPGNIRELEQCVRNVMIRREYRPAQTAAHQSGDDPSAALARAVRDGALTADELLSGYCTLVYAQAGSFEEAARRLGLDRRTVKSKVDPELLERFGQKD